jgi:hypothetical protein
LKGVAKFGRAYQEKSIASTPMHATSGNTMGDTTSISNGVKLAEV